VGRVALAFPAVSAAGAATAADTAAAAEEEKREKPSNVMPGMLARIGPGRGADGRWMQVRLTPPRSVAWRPMATEAHVLPAAVRADRRALAAIAAGHLSSDLCQGAVPALLPYLISQRGLSYAGATALLLALTVSSSVIQPLLGHASDRMQGAWLMPAGVLVGGTGIALTGVTGGYAATLAAVVLGGIGVAAFHPEGARYVPLVAGSRASTGMGLYSVGGNAGFVVGPVVVTAGVAVFGLRGTLLVAVIPALSALLLWSVRPRLVAAAEADRAGPRDGAMGADDWGAFALLSAMVVARTAVGYGLLAFVPIWFVRHLHASTGAGNAALTLLLAAGAAGTLLGGRLADRYGARPVVVGGMAALFPLIALLPLAGEAAAFPLCAAVGLALDANFGITVVLAQRLLPSRPGAASGIVLGFAFGLGGAVAAGLGVVADRSGLTAVMAALAGVALLAFVLSLFCRVPRG
jgi:FSR family fosmidomycin resistance protein-like MFS transporter